MSRIKRIVLFFILFLCVIATERTFAFWYGEHKFIGDQSFNKAIISDVNKAQLWSKIVGTDPTQQKAAILNLPNQSLKIITYGDLTASSGEYENEFRQFFYMSLRQYPQYWTCWDPRSLQNAKSDSGIIEKIKRHYKVEQLSLNKEDAYNDVNIIFSDGSHFSVENATHFAEFGSTHTLNDELSNAVQRFVVIPDGRFNSTLEYQISRQLFYRGASINSADWKMNIAQIDSFFNSISRENIASKYCVLHTVAMQFADLAGAEYAKNSITEKAKLLIQISFMFNAYADHFLQDAFSSGHLVVRRKELNSFNGKGAHDYYNKEGIQVDNVDVSPWIAYGDGFLDTNQINYQKVLQASINSINDVWNRFTQHSRYPASPTMLEELHDKSEKQVLAMFMRQYTAMRVMPLPVELGQVEFSSSRNGLFIGSVIAMPKLLSSNLFPDADFQIGFGKNFWFGHDSRMKNKESNLWLACSVSYGWFSPTNETAPFGLARLSILESVWFNSFIFDPFSYRFIQLNNATDPSKGANSFMGKNHLFAIWNPSLGYEYKLIQSKWSWAVRLNYLSLTSNLQKKWYPSIQLRRYL